MTNGSAPKDVLVRSVTRGDHADSPYGSTLLLTFPTGPATPGLPAYWSVQRDFALAQTPHLDDMWAGALSKAITKYAARGFTVEDSGDSKQRVKRAQDLFMYAGGPDLWEAFIAKHLRNFLTTDNGAFVEIVRAQAAYGSRIIGIMHLDSHRVTRTGDPEIPVLYRDKQSREHMLKAHQVMCFADMPDPGDSWNGVGLCAASRAWKTIAKMAAMNTYLREKVTGERVTSIYIVNGVTPEQLQGALTTADADKARRGFVMYKGALVIPVMDLAVPPTVVEIPLSEVPDGFNAKEERDDAYLVYANAIGVSVQDIKPLSGQGLGTGQQSVILDDAAEAQGSLPVWAKAWLHMANTWLLPATTTFSWNTNDLRDQKAKADVRSVRAATRAAQIASGEITPDEARQIAVDDDDIPRELLAVDETPGDAVQDEEKPVEESQQQPEAEVPEVVETKAKKRRKFADVAKLLDQEEDAAVKLFEEVAGDK